MFVQPIYKIMKETQVLTTRPKIAELVIQLYGRTLHPELFEVCRTKSIVRGNPDESGYQAEIQITNAGHIVTWRHGPINSDRSRHFFTSTVT